MKKLHLLLISIFALFVLSCNDDSEDLKIDNQVAIENYLQTNNITAENSVSGLYWSIEQEGNGESPANAYSNVTVNYRGYNPFGEEFDSGTITDSSLKNYILGWQEGIPKFSKGGSGKLFIPAHLAYGENPPSNSNFIIFDIELIDFTDN